MGALDWFPGNDRKLAADCVGPESASGEAPRWLCERHRSHGIPKAAAAGQAPESAVPASEAAADSEAAEAAGGTPAGPAAFE
ncbi:hypothetical protein [Actinacidiphila acididurans]|uniref:Uncharacterized protein n=1 Tax=Actinacidiphila acididurans TaxID=2784346 RepID=A0ABS2TXR0_9ACTN|nr:hypothetical protein [Actinacidiphila acididurans]MBM9506738.1 hypothetical protein [Actinacidiphila acididurans]